MEKNREAYRKAESMRTNGCHSSAFEVESHEFGGFIILFPPRLKNPQNLACNASHVFESIAKCPISRQASSPVRRGRRNKRLMRSSE
jgi:hypothetical protein